MTTILGDERAKQATPRITQTVNFTNIETSGDCENVLSSKIILVVEYRCQIIIIKIRIWKRLAFT